MVSLSLNNKRGAGMSSKMVTSSSSSTFSTDKSKFKVELWDLIEQYRGYFIKLHKDKADEVMQQVWEHMCNNAKPGNKPMLVGYMKKVAETITKTKVKLLPYSTYDAETGEVAPVFRTEQTLTEDYQVVYEQPEVREGVLRVLITLYLRDKGKMKSVFEHFDAEVDRQLHNKTPRLITSRSKLATDSWFVDFHNLLTNYPSAMVLSCLQELRTDITKQDKKKRYTDSALLCIGAIPYNDINLNYLYPVTLYNKGKTSYICSDTLRMSEPDLDIDHVMWQVDDSDIKKSKVLRICITPIMDKLISNIYADEGVNTPNKEWFKGYYILKSLSGQYSTLNEDSEKFIEYCRKELILSLAPRLDRVIGISEDFIYFSPRRKLNWGTIEFNSNIGSFQLDLMEVNLK